MKCRCGADADQVCHLCKEDICRFHSTGHAVSTQMAGYVRTRMEPVCFPSCTSEFGGRDEPSTASGTFVWLKNAQA